MRQQDERTPETAALAKQPLGTDSFALRTVAHGEIGQYYQAADAFVLASLHEGFGRVFVEAMSHGLPCLAHDYAQARVLLGETGYYADFAAPHQLTQLFSRLLQDIPAEGEEAKCRRQQSVRKRFGWAELRLDYVAMINRCAGAAG